SQMSIPPPMSLSQSLPTSVPSSSAPSSSAPSSVALPPAAFTALPPSSIHTVLSDSSALVLDIRPHNVYVQARIPNALSLSVPSTLLKRPNFPLARLAEMLPTSFARDKLSKWPQASRILVYDSDSASLPPNLTSSNLLGLMRKFRSEGYPAAREIAWLRGGFHAVWTDYPDLVDRSPPPDELDEDEEQGEPETDGNPALLAKTASASGTSRVLRAKHLPQAAFTSATTISLRRKAMQPAPTVPLQVVPPTSGIQLDDPLSKLPVTSTSVAAVPPPIVKASRSGRAEFTLSLPPGLVKSRTMPGTTSGPMVSMLTLSPQYTHPGTYNRVASYSVPGRQIRDSITSGSGYSNSLQVAFNPFFDTIRQNIELGNKSAATEGIPLKLPRRVRRRVGELPFKWLREIARKSRRSTESSSSISEASGSCSDSDGHHGDGNDSNSFAGASTIEQDSTSTSRTLQRPSQSQFAMTAHRSPPSSPSSQPIPIQVSRPRFGSDSPPSPTSSSHSQTPPEAHEFTRALEMQFYKIELGEQKRLLGVMERHSMESGKVIHEGSGVRGSLGLGFSNSSPRRSLPLSYAEDSKAAAITAEEAMQPFPYSITAGLEKGAKNRSGTTPAEEARKHLERAAYLNFAPAQYKLGHAYEFATHPFPFDALLSVQYYSLASQQGEVEADMALSKWFLCGAEGAFDKDEGLAWTFAEKAARKNLPAAEFALGYYSEVGVGGPKDFDAARKWYTRAAQHGNADAQERLQALSQPTPQALSREQHENLTDAKLVRKRTQAKQRSEAVGGALPVPAMPATQRTQIVNNIRKNSIALGRPAGGPPPGPAEWNRQGAITNSPPGMGQGAPLPPVNEYANANVSVPGERLALPVYLSVQEGPNVHTRHRTAPDRTTLQVLRRQHNPTPTISILHTSDMVQLVRVWVLAPGPPRGPRVRLRCDDLGLVGLGSSLSKHSRDLLNSLCRRLNGPRSRSCRTRARRRSRRWGSRPRSSRMTRTVS
ncbi:hypothetical protein C8Q74DRAFT_1289079, partial [Fomes fomentarius]